jgi:hypothetical protein
MKLLESDVLAELFSDFELFFDCKKSLKSTAKISDSNKELHLSRELSILITIILYPLNSKCISYAITLLIIPNNNFLRT